MAEGPFTLADLRRACEEKIAACGPGTHLVLVLGKRSRPRGERMRLLPRGGPLGRFVGETETGSFIVDFVAAEIVAWLDKKEADRG